MKKGMKWYQGSKIKIFGPVFVAILILMFAAWYFEIKWF